MFALEVDVPSEPTQLPSNHTNTSSDIDLEGKNDSPSTSPNGTYLVEFNGECDPRNPLNFSPVRKWLIVTIVASGSLLVTATSSLYTSCYDQLDKEFGSSQIVATLGLSLFVVGLAVGPMVASPLSEFYGRQWIYNISMFLFLLFLIPCAAAQNIQTMLVGRFFNGLVGSAFLSVAAGTVADLFTPSEIQGPMMLYTVAPFIGPVLGPVIGGFINSFTSWRWSFYVLLIWTGALQIALIYVPETHHPTILHRKAIVIRKESGNLAYKSSSETTRAQTSLSTALIHSLYRPFQLLALELMCLCLCLYSAVLLGILYLFFGAFPLVFRANHDFDLWQTGLTFIPLAIGMLLGVASSPLWHKNYLRLVANANDKAKEAGAEPPVKGDPEFRLPPAIVGAVFVTAGIFWFGWTTYRSVHWIVPLIASSFFGTGIFLVFSSIWTFLVDAYPRYAASALAANTFARCMFAAAFPLFGEQMYKKLDYQWATSLLAFITLAMLPLPYVFFVCGKSLRARSKFAST